MEAKTRFEARHAFVLEVEHVDKIWRSLEEKGMVVKATVHCSDGIVRQYDKMESLLNYENPRRATISAISFYGRIGDPYSTAEIDFGVRYSKPISVSISGEESTISSMRMSISGIVDGMRPWYSRIAILDLAKVWFSVFIVVMLLAQIMSPSGGAKSAVPFREALSVLSTLAAVIGVIVLVILGVSRLRNRCFPVSTFAIGQGAVRYRLLELFRWGVIVSFMVSVASSIMIAWVGL